MKENHVSFYEKHLSRYDSIVLPNENFLEQQFKTFNGDEMENQELLGSDHNGEEEEYKTLSYEDFNYNLVVTNFLLRLWEKYNQQWRTQRII